MRTVTLGRLAAVAPGDIQGVIAGIDRILPLLVSVPSAERFRSIIADDVALDGELFSPEAFTAIRAGQVGIFLVDPNTLAIDGRKIREFLPVWNRIVLELGLAGEAKIRPVAEITSRDINDSIARLSDARNALIGVPTRIEQPKKRALWPWLLAGAGVAGTAVLIAKYSPRYDE